MRGCVTWVALLLATVARGAQAQEPELRFDRLTPAELEPYVQRILDAATQDLERLLAVRGVRTVENTLRPYDNFRIAVNRARIVSFLQNHHPDAAIRDAAARAENRLTEFNQQRRGDRRIYDMLAAVDTTSADVEVRYWLRRELESFRRESVNRDANTRARANALEQEMNRLRTQWEENFRSDTITAAFHRSELAGLDEAWMAPRSRGRGDSVFVEGDLRMVITRAVSGATRERAMRIQMRPRRNHFVLDTLLRLRYEYATLLGYRNWADYQLRGGSMAGSPQRVRAFLDEIRRVSEPALRRTIETRLAGIGTSSGDGRPTIGAWDLMYQNEELDGPPRGAALRPYLPYPRVRDGMLVLAREFLDLEFRPAPDLPVWHPTVEPYRVYEKGRLIAKVYFDVHWRPGRSPTGASTSNFRLGIKDRVLTEVAIIGGMVRASAGETPLLGPRPMQTLFHEFGHLLHTLVAVRPWFATSGLPDGEDFREVPSSLFEAWARDPVVVARFARHYQTGEPPPPELLATLGETSSAGGFMAQGYARMSLELHDRAPGNMDGVARQAFADVIPPDLAANVMLPEGDIHPEVVLPHIGGGYQAAYYTYLWSQAIAADLLGRFDKGLLDPVAITAYRRQILEPGRSQPATELVESFLGRPFTLEAWARGRR